MINVLNPKVALFFLAFLPQFIQTEATAPIQIFMLGILFAGLGFVYQALLAIFSTSARRVITEKELVNNRPACGKRKRSRRGRGATCA